MSSAVHTLRQMKIQISIMANVVYSCCWCCPLHQWTPENGMGTLEYWRCMPCIIWVMMIRRLKVLYTVPAAGIDIGLQLSSPCLSSLFSQLLQASVTIKIMALRPSPPANLIKTPFRVNPLAFGVFAVYFTVHCSSSTLKKISVMHVIKLGFAPVSFPPG